MTNDFEETVFLKKEVIDKALKNIYTKNFDITKDIEPELYKATLDLFNKTIDNSFGKVEFGKPNYDFVQELKYNNAVFAAFKTHRQQNDIAQLLTDDNGKLKNFTEFKKDVSPIIGQYNENWLKTEYNTAVIRARQTANFKKFEQDADIFPNLKWLPSTSIEKRKEHVPFYNTVRPINDEFWKLHFPGNVWNCKCRITNTDETVTELDYPKQGGDKGLKTNPVFTRSIFDFKTHPYAQNGYLPANTLLKVVTDYVDKTTYKPIVLKEYKNGGKVIISNLLNKQASDYKDLTIIADYFAKKEAKIVEILPKLHFKDDNYKLLFNGAYKNKCPDLKINNEFYEYESSQKPVNKTKLKNMIGRGLKQSDKILIEIDDNVNTSFIKKLINNRIREKQKVSEVWIYKNKKLDLIYKTQ